ncbi:hypothetical protein ZOSMA_185G00480 [Zostera marina]|uniref:Uncharacterized protein n=1 Tax=Zostera marina TaxID=29655 RepID=A0A0K9PQK3_ZOSMR|nr:hypothetical protein ZOSMA_185G00480 [Zostera marina]
MNDRICILLKICRQRGRVHRFRFSVRFCRVSEEKGSRNEKIIG